MAASKSKLKDQAANLLRKGKYEKALELYRQVVQVDPDDFAARRNVGYILQKLGRKEEAIQAYVELADEYAQDGFLLKAIATCKVVLEIDPGHTEIQNRVAELVARRSAASENRTPVKVLAPADEESADQAAPAAPAVAAMDALGGFGMVELASASTPMEHLESVGLAEPESDHETEAEVEPESEAQTETAAEPEAWPAPAFADIEPLSIEPVELQPMPLQPAGDTTGPGPSPTEPGDAPELQAAAGVEAAEVDDGLPDVDIDVDFREQTEGKQATSLPEIPLFSDLEPDAFVAILERMEMRHVKAGEWVIREGDAGDCMFTIASGRVRVLKQLQGSKMLQLALLGEGAFFGEMSVLIGGPRGASIQALEPCELFVISRELLDRVTHQYGSVQEVLNKFARQRLLRNAMNTSPLFKPFEREERIQIIERFVSREVEPGLELVTEGKETDGLYLVLRGRMQVVKHVDGGEIEVGSLTEGEVFGEISCLRKRPAIASVRVQTPGSVLRLPRSDFEELVLSHPQILELIDRLGEENIAKTANALAEKGILI